VTVPDLTDDLWADVDRLYPPGHPLQEKALEYAHTYFPKKVVDTTKLEIMKEGD
jgi:hypothetical protein